MYDVWWCFLARPISNTMLKHLGVCRAAGGEKPPKSEGGLGASFASGGVSEVVYAFLSVELSYVYKHQKRYWYLIYHIFIYYFLKRSRALWWTFPECSSSKARVKLSFTIFCWAKVRCCSWSSRIRLTKALRTDLVRFWMSVQRASTVEISCECWGIVVIIIV